jgi:2'-5' RNA ligase
MSSTGAAADGADALAARRVEHPRLFLALWPDAGVRAALARRSQACTWPAGAAIVPPQRLHLTLHFIGAVAPARLPELAHYLRVPLRPCVLTLDRLAAWPRGLAVLEASAVPEALAALHRDLAAALGAAGLPVEQRRFAAHVTLARHAAAAALPGRIAPLHWPVNGYALLRSHPGPAPRYELLWRQGAALLGDAGTLA